MKIEKKIISNLTKCYSIAPLTYNGKEYFLVAAEKIDPCLLFDLDGNQKDVVWEGPGGTMSMVQVPGSNGQFLATHKFYSPNDSAEAKIVIVTPKTNGVWEVRTLVNLPFVHRFDVLECNGIHYLIACTLKSAHRCKDDWSSPGKVYAAQLPDNLEGYSEENQLKLAVLYDGLTRNHGYCRMDTDDGQAAIVSADEGVFQFVPPQSPDGEWEINRLLDEAASDAVLVDFDGDGEKELAVIAPFHGEKIRIYKNQENTYRQVYEYEKDVPFAHAIYGGLLCGKETLVIGHRKGNRDLLMFTYNENSRNYEVQVMDRNCGPANVYHYRKDGKDVLVSTNREIDEVALYIVDEDE